MDEVLVSPRGFSSKNPEANFLDFSAAFISPLRLVTLYRPYLGLRRGPRPRSHHRFSQSIDVGRFRIVDKLYAIDFGAQFETGGPRRVSLHGFHHSLEGLSQDVADGQRRHQVFRIVWSAN